MGELLKNKVCMVTGSARGIGKEIALLFVSEGAEVVVNGTRPGSADGWISSSEYSNHLHPYYFDISDPAAVRQNVMAIKKQFGHIDVLINNAGISHQELFQSVSEEKASEIFKINIESAVSLTKYLVPSMINKHSGVVLNISSMWGVVGASCEVHYSTAKSAMTGFTRALAKEVGPSGIRVNCIAPGFIDTKMNSKFSKEDVEALRDDTPLMKIGKCEDIAELALFLASEKASFITGQIITVDGGLTL
jgi:3-oxoacyl-[acyl-carrier protein] reductase